MTYSTHKYKEIFQYSRPSLFSASQFNAQWSKCLYNSENINGSSVKIVSLDK